MTINLNMDPNILLSVINTKLRNDYDSLPTLAKEENINMDELKEALKKNNFFYDPDSNQFK